MESNKSYEDLDNIIEQPIVSKDLLFIFQITNNVFISQFFAVFGSVTNIFNMIVFAKTGFKDTINISLFALAVSDFGACFTMIFPSLALNPWFNSLQLPFYPIEMSHLVSGLPRVILTKITTAITTFITFERCLCVAMPLKVKSILTPTRVKIFLTSFYIIAVASYTPIIYIHRLSWRFDPSSNLSILGVSFTDDREQVESVSFKIHTSLFLNVTFIPIVIFTVILAVQLKRKARWRQSATTSVTDASSKETKVVKMVVIISTLFIACFIPHSIFLIIVSIYPEFSVTGAQSNLYLTAISFIATFETINSSMNIVIYYYNSSNYRNMFNNTFCIPKKSVNCDK